VGGYSRQVVLGIYLDIRRRDIANDIPMVIDHNQRRYSLSVHQLKAFTERLIAAEIITTVSLQPKARSKLSGRGLLDGDHIVGSNAQIVQSLGVKLLNRRKAAAILPKELDQSELTEDTNHFLVIGLLGHDNAMDTAAEGLYRCENVRGCWQRNKRFLLHAQGLDILKRDLLSISSFLGKLIIRCAMSFLRGGQPRGQQKYGCTGINQDLGNVSLTAMKFEKHVDGKPTFVASSTPVSNSTNCKSSGLTSSPMQISRQSRPIKAESTVFGGGGLSIKL
jgi:hypothetical protein